MLLCCCCCCCCVAVAVPNAVLADFDDDVAVSADAVVAIVIEVATGAFVVDVSTFVPSAAFNVVHV